MTKKQTKQDKIRDLYTVFKCLKENRPVRRSGRKDGGIPTHPTLPCANAPEAIVLKNCLRALKQLGLVHDRNNVGTGFIGGGGQMYSFGIKNAGDIIGAFRNGVHFEIECKHGKGGILSSGQQKRMKEIRDSNCVYIVAHSAAEMLSELQEYL